MHILSTILAFLSLFFHGPTTPPNPIPQSYPQVIHTSAYEGGAPADGGSAYDVNHIAATEALLKAGNAGSQLLGATNVIETPVAVFHTSLANAITSAATAMTLVSGLTADGTTLASSTYSFVIDSGQSDQEFVIADCTNTVCTNMQRGLSVITGTSSIASAAQNHRRTATVDIVDAPLLLKITSIVNGVSGFPNLISYTNSTDCAPGHSTHVLCTGTYLENYANNVIAGGSPTSTATLGGKVLLGTQAQQASSFNGGVNAPTVLQTQFATSTCQTVGAYAVIASTTTGKIDQNCIDKAANYTYTGIVNIASSTIGTSTQATTTITGTLTYKGKTVTTPAFGGTGVDGALSISSGTTTIALGTNNYYEKDYTSISITGTGSLNFSSAATSSSGVTVVLRSQGACTFTSSSMTMIDLRWLGGGLATAGGIGAVGSGSGGVGGAGGGSTAGQGSRGGDVFGGTNGNGFSGQGGMQLPALASSTNLALPGGNGGGGGGGTGAGGNPGLGAGGLYIECAGAYNFTTGGFMASGAGGSNGVQSNGTGSGGGGGGGGAGGNIFVRYGSLTANSGTYTLTAGGGGSGGAANGASAGQAGGAAAAGSHLEVANTTNY